VRGPATIGISFSFIGTIIPIAANKRSSTAVLLSEVVAVAGLDDQVFLFAGDEMDLIGEDDIAIVRRASALRFHRVSSSRAGSVSGYTITGAHRFLASFIE
jgi:hypothetical protein